MDFKYLIAAGLIGSTVLTGCMTSQNFVDDDVYVVKAAELPVDTDVSDETDYNTFVYNQQQNNRRNRYYDDFYRQQLMWGMRPAFGFGFGQGYRPGWNNSVYFGYGNPYYGGFYDPWGWGYNDPFYNPYGYYGYYNPYGPYHPYGGYGYPYYGGGYPYYGGGGTVVHQSPGLHLRGPRGSSAGMGGVSSRSAVALKSGTVGSTQGTGSRARATASVSEKPLTARPVNTTTTVGNTQSRVVNAPVSRTGSSGTTVSSPGRTNPAPVRPTVERREAAPGSSSGRTISPSRSGGASNGNSNQRTPATVTPSRSSGNSGTSSGSSGSSRSSSPSSGGSVSKPGRP